MPKQTEQLAASLTEARRFAGLSQRALGVKVGLAQSHVSKIERATVDPQLSSLLEIARALGLELMLVPAKLVPTVRALQRESVPDPRRTPSTIDQDLTRLAQRARQVLRRFPDLKALSDLAAAAGELRTARVDESSAGEARSLIDHATAVLNRLRGDSSGRPEVERAAMIKSAADEVISLARAIRNLRNAWMHRDMTSPQTPAYRISDE